MPRVTQISYGKTFNDGNFESTRLDLTAELGLNESYDDAFKDLFDKVEELREIQLDRVYKPKKNPTKDLKDSDFDQTRRRRTY